MKIAIPLFHTRVSPRFDFAPTLMVATVEKNQVVEKKEISLKNHTLSQRSNLLQELGVTTLICGGVQEFLTRSLENKNVQVIAPVAGEAIEVLQRFLHGTLCSSFKPFCPRPGFRRCQRRHQGIGNGRNEKRLKDF